MFTSELMSANYKVSVSDLRQKLENYKGIKLEEKQFQQMYDIFGERQTSGEPLENRIISVKELVSSKLDRNLKRVDQLINL